MRQGLTTPPPPPAPGKAGATRSRARCQIRAACARALLPPLAPAALEKAGDPEADWPHEPPGEPPAPGQGSVLHGRSGESTTPPCLTQASGAIVWHMGPGRQQGKLGGGGT